MKRSWSIMLKVAGALFLVGIVFSAAGVMMGAKTIEYEDGEFVVGHQSAGSLFQFGLWHDDDESYPVQNVRTVNLPDNTQIMKIEVEETIGNLRVVQGERWVIEYAVAFPEKFFYQLDNGKLKIEYKREKNIAKVKGSEQITLTVPKDAALQELDIESALGNVDIKNLVCDEIEVASALGNLTLQNISAQKLSIDGALGDITMQNSVVNGKLEISEAMGDANIQGIFQGNVEIDGGMGDIHLTVQDAGADDYNLNLQRGLGELKIDGETLTRDLKRNNGQNREIKVDGGLGNITVDFD